VDRSQSVQYVGKSSIAARYEMTALHLAASAHSWRLGLARMVFGAKSRLINTSRDKSHARGERGVGFLSHKIFGNSFRLAHIIKAPCVREVHHKSPGSAITSETWPLPSRTMTTLAGGAGRLRFVVGLPRKAAASSRGKLRGYSHPRRARRKCRRRRRGEGERDGRHGG